MNYNLKCKCGKTAQTSIAISDTLYNVCNKCAVKLLLDRMIDLKERIKELEDR